MREIIAKIIIDDVAYDQPKASNIVDRTTSKTSKVASAQPSFDTVLSTVGEKAKAANPLGNTLKFDFGGQQLFIDGTNGSNQINHSDGNADCTVSISQEDFIKLVQGNLNPMGAVMSGKMKIDGDMGVAMKLQELF